MSILEVSILAAAALLIGFFSHAQIRTHLLLLASLLVVYWLQSRAVEITSITFWLPTLTVMLVIFSWLVTASAETRSLRKNWPGIFVILLTILTIDLTRYLGETSPLFPDMAMPEPFNVFVVLAFFFLIVFAVTRMTFLQRFTLPVLLLMILITFLMIKFPAWDAFLYKSISKFMGSSSQIGDTFVWLGFSYFAFRITHTLRDRQKGLLPPVTLAEYVTYVLFFPSFVAGPIDRIERFIGDLRASSLLSDDDYLFAGRRFLIGLFKKFVIADALAMFALNPKLLPQLHSTGWFWVVLYAYTFQIYFDFSGYSDIAIGVARLAGIRLPENFNAPYLKANLTLFWNNWHITLTQWFRAYYFNPMQRWVRSTGIHIPTWLLVLALQLSTMLLIGLWHGITVSFVIWGAWHAFGLFLHNRWRDTMAARISAWANTPFRQTIWTLTGIFITFHYVAVGWVFFVLPVDQLPQAVRLLLGLSS